MKYTNNISDSLCDASLRDDYLYSLRCFEPSDYHDGNEISELEVLNAHYSLSDYFIEVGEEARYGVLNYNLLSSAVHRQNVEFCGQKKWNDDFHKMATLLYGLTMDHAFHDGNKRTALLSVLLYLNKCKREIIVPATKFEDLVVKIASNSLYMYNEYRSYLCTDDPAVNFISDKIRSWTRKRNNQLYTVTYAECNAKLKRFNIVMDSPSGNAINVYKLEKGWIPLIDKGKEKKKRLCQVGFPGWKKQISESTLKTILVSAGLTAKDGVDSDVFFRDAAPTYELLSYYRKPLARLKDK